MAAMSDAVPEAVSHSLAVSDRSAYFEQLLFVLSPFGTLPTALLIFTLLAGTLAIAFAASGEPILSIDGGKLVVGRDAQVGLWLCLLSAVVLGIQRYARQGERRDIARFALLFGGDWQLAASVTELTPRDAALLPVSLLGLVAGLVQSWLVYVAPAQNLRDKPALLAWFFFVNTLVVIAFFRGLALTRSGSRAFQQVLDSAVTIDLLRVDRLNVIGRSAARIALIWFTVGAVALVAFIGGGFTVFTVSFVAVSIAIGAAAFIGTMERVHRKIVAAKKAELERVRAEVDALRPLAPGDPGAAQRLQGVLAYEARVMTVREWPFDETTLVRVCASTLILTVPWFGQAFAAFAVDRLSHFAG